MKVVVAGRVSVVVAGGGVAGAPDGCVPVDWAAAGTEQTASRTASQATFLDMLKNLS
jgi:hypothetical protein